MADTRYPKIIEGQKGPNGHPVGYDDDGNLVEWIPADQPGHEGEIWPMIMRRSDDTISDEYQRLWDKVWWNRHMSHHAPGCECGKHKPRCGCDKRNFVGCDGARALVDRYGLEFLAPGDPVEWGITQGKMMALAWVHGSEWDGSGDT